MDTRESKNNASKGADDLGRHQRVLDVYLAHAGDDAMPPPALDAKLLALAARAVNSTNTTSVETTFARSEVTGISSVKSSTRSRRRRWPFALAASVASIGLVAILARTNFQDREGYGEPVYQAPSYEAKSVAADQIAAAAPIQEETPDISRKQAEAQSMADTADKAKMSSERTVEQAVGRLSAPPQMPAPHAVEHGTTADTAVARPSVPAVASAPTPMPAEEGDLTVSQLGAPSAELEADMLSQRGGMDSAPAVNLAAESAEVPAPTSEAIEQPAVTEEEKTASKASNEAQTSQAPQASMRMEPAQSGASKPLDDRTKKDEFAPDAHTDAANPHAKTFSVIRALRDSGEVMKAAAMLARFQKAYPKAQLPEDMVALAKTK